MPEIVHDPDRMRALVVEARAAGRRVGFVPTMGAIHAGHASLVARAAACCDDVAVSIFVNPTQFGPQEDFARYPRTLAADAAVLEPHGVRWIYAPDVAAVYPPGDATRIVVGGPAVPLEGERRPGHFDGVATVVCKLFAECLSLSRRPPPRRRAFGEPQAGGAALDCRGRPHGDRADDAGDDGEAWHRRRVCGARRPRVARPAHRPCHAGGGAGGWPSGIDPAHRQP